ncbi:MAG: hypothetical protein ACHQM6_05395 [Candidatus Kapaibacterium sp.]
MRIAMFMRWEGVTLDQYEEVRQIVNWEGNVPKGSVLHICSHDGKSLRITDVWESAEDLNNFVNNRLMPETSKIVNTQPQVEVYPLHALFTPAFEDVVA